MSLFDWPVRVYYEDTDSGGVVYHANYLKFMERARTEWLRERGFEQDSLKDEHNCLFAVHSMQINYRLPALFNDALVIRTEITTMSGASIQFEQSVLRDGELLCHASVRVACLDALRFKPRPIPSFILTEMQCEC